MGSTVHRKRVLANARASYKKAKAARAKKVKVVESKAAKKPTVKKVVKKVVKKDKPVKEAPIGIRKPVKEAPIGIRKPVKNQTTTNQPNKKSLIAQTLSGENLRNTTSKKASENKKRGYSRARKR